MITLTVPSAQLPFFGTGHLGAADLSSRQLPLIAIFLIKWLLIPENAALLNWIGFLFGGAGIVLALVGLHIALRQLRAIKTETQASKAAIDAVQIKIAAFDTAQECQTARSLISGIQGHLQARDWSKIITAYEELIQSFLRLSHSNSAISSEDRLLLRKMTRDMAGILEGIRRKSSDSSAPITLRGQDQALRDFSDIMTKITFTVVKDLQQ